MPFYILLSLLALTFVLFFKKKETKKEQLLDEIKDEDLYQVAEKPANVAEITKLNKEKAVQEAKIKKPISKRSTKIKK